MNSVIMPIVILLPIFCGAFVPVLPFKNRKQMEIYIEAAVVLNSVLVIWLLFHRPQEVFTMFRSEERRVGKESGCGGGAGA